MTAGTLALPPIIRSAPEPTSHVIARDNVIDALERQLSAGTKVVTVEGDDGAGKTTLLAQFLSRHRSRSVGLFVSGSSPLAHHPEELRFDLCNQLECSLTGQELGAREDADEDALRIRLRELQERCRREDSL